MQSRKKEEASSSSSYIASSLSSTSSRTEPLSYESERELARHSFAKVNGDVLSIVFDYLGMKKDTVLNVENATHLVLAEDILGTASLTKAPDVKKVYLQSVKELVLSIMCDMKSYTTDDAVHVRRIYSQFLDLRIQAIEDFDQARYLLINYFHYHPICQGRISHNSPLNVACTHYGMPKKELFPLFQQLLNVEGIDVNAFDALYFSSNAYQSRTQESFRFAPIHHLMDVQNASVEHDENTQLYLQELLAHGADINLKTSIDEETALHIAAKNVRPHLVRFMLTLPNIELLACDSKGRTPIDLARIAIKGNKRDETLKILEDAIKQSHESGTKSKCMSHLIKKTLFGNCDNMTDTANAVAEPVCDSLGHVLGGTPR